LFVFFMDRKSAFILIGAVPIIIFFMILLGIAAEKKADKQYTTYKRLSNHFLDSLRGLETLAYIGRSKQHGKQIGKVSEDYRKATMTTLRVAFLSSFALDFFTSLSIAFVAVGLGLRLIDGTVLLFPALTILILAPEYFAPIKQVGKDYHATLDGQVAMTQIEGLLDQGEPENHIDSVEKLLPVNIKTVNMNHVTVVRDGQKLLTDISFAAEKGWMGIVGETGAGKSTLISALAGRLPITSGGIEVDGINVDEQRDHWYEKIAY